MPIPFLPSRGLAALAFAFVIVACKPSNETAASKIVDDATTSVEAAETSDTSASTTNATPQPEPAKARKAFSKADLAKTGGQLHAVTKTCEDYSAAEQAQMKQEQKALLAEFGVDAATFDRYFAEGEQDVSARRQTLSSAQQAEFCKHYKGAQGVKELRRIYELLSSSTVTTRPITPLN